MMITMVMVMMIKIMIILKALTINYREPLFVYVLVGG